MRRGMRAKDRGSGRRRGIEAAASGKVAGMSAHVWNRRWRLLTCPAPTAPHPIGRPIRLCDNAHFPFPLRLTP